jgi:hypothetical protein
MAQQVFTVEFDFVSIRANGPDQKRTMTVRAPNAVQAANIAWSSRGTQWGEFGTDNAIDCRVIN